MRCNARFLILLILTLILSYGSISQCKTYNLDFESPIQHCKTVLDFDSISANQKHESILRERGVTAMGEVIPVDYNFPSDGTDFGNSLNLYVQRMTLVVPEAENLSLKLEEIHLDEGASIYISFGYYRIKVTKEDLKHSDIYILPSVPFNEVNISLYSQKFTPVSSSFKITEVRVMNQSDANSRGSDCNVDVNCEEGEDWSAQRDAVVKIIVNEGGTLIACTGTLMNNTYGDQRRLVLSALHCMSDATAAELNSAVVIFNNEDSDCNAQDAAETHMLVGLTKLADSNDAVDGQPNPEGSDFILLEIQDPIPSEWTPYWAGWKAINSPSGSGVCIHHADGDEKKISTYSSPTVSTFIGASGSHWGVNWDATPNGHGVTESGSSGSPLFDSNGLVIGTLTGGFSDCVESGDFGPDESDYFGKLSFHWLSNPNSADQKLKNFLDPWDSGLLALEGSYDPVLAVAELDFEKSSPKVFPSAFTDGITVEFSNSKDWKELSIYDTQGRKVYSQNIPRNRIFISLDWLTEGTYIVRFQSNNLDFSSSRIVKY